MYTNCNCISARKRPEKFLQAKGMFEIIFWGSGRPNGCRTVMNMASLLCQLCFDTVRDYLLSVGLGASLGTFVMPMEHSQALQAD